MLQILDKYGNTSTDSGNLIITDKNGNVKKLSGGITSIETSAPITGGTITTTGTIGITKATSSSNGYLSSTDWTTFNSKQNTITTGTTSQYFRGDLSLATFPTNVSTFNNDSGYITSTALSPYLTSATAASTYEPIIAAGTTSQYWRGDKTWQTFPTIPTVGTWGALNYPTWVSGTPFVKMTATGTFSLDTNTYLTSVGTGTTNELTYWSGTNTLGSLSTATYPSLTELSYVKGVTSAIQTQLGTKQDLSLSAYTLRANNTASAANATDNTFVDTSGAYTGTITFTGTGPGGTTNYSYRYTQVGKMCTININLSYTTAASCTSVTLTLPTICAAPVSPGGMGSNNEFIYPGYGMTWSTKSIPVSTGLNSARTCWMRKNASGVNEMVIFNYSAASTIFLSGTVIYWTS